MEPIQNEIIALLNEWWLATTRSLVENIGSEGSLRSLKPYWDNGGRASAFNLRQMTGDASTDVKKITAILMTQRSSDGFLWTLKAKGGENSAIVEMLTCPVFRSEPPIQEICMSICGYSANGTIDALNPDYQCNLVRSLSFGDKDCCWVIRRRDGSGFNEDEEEFEEIRPAKICKNIFNNLAMAYIGEFWIMSTRAFLDRLEVDRVFDILDVNMRKSGLEFGKRKKGDITTKKEGFDLIVHLIDLIEETNYKNGRSAKTLECIVEKEITDCPFSSAPPMICLQFQSFFNGICEAIDPTYEFAYDKMMTKGDKTCHWVIKKKGANAQEARINDPEVEEMQRMLKWRLTKGEITIEQFRQLRDALMER